MKKELSPLLKFFVQVPTFVGILLFIGAFIVAFAAGTDLGALLFVLFLVLSLVLIIGKGMAQSKLRQLRLGTNPNYLVTQFPNNLDSQVNYLVANENFEISTKSDSSAILKRRPEFSVASAIVWFLLGVIPGVIYVIWYLTRPDETVHLDLTTQ